MNLKQRFTLIFSLLFSGILGSVLISVYFLFTNFRQQEFHSRLVQRAENTIKFLVGVKEIDKQLLELYDRNRVNRLSNEKTSVYNNKKELLYTSNNSYFFNWSKRDFRKVEKNRVFYTKKRKFDVVGIKYKYSGNTYYVLTSAEDINNNPYINYLKYVLLGAFVFGTFAASLLSYYLSKESFKPLDRVRNEIQEITDKNLNKRLPISEVKDEINALSVSFNQMIDRIEKAYQRQKQFTGNASHEIRTPIARITAQIENILQEPELDKNLKLTLKNISKDTYQLSDIVTSLLLLSEINNSERLKNLNLVRLDEVIFQAASQILNTNKGFKFHFSIENKTSNDVKLEIDGDETLLRMAFINLFKNAYLYSDNKNAICLLVQNPEGLIINVINSGRAPQVNDTTILFNTFVRGDNVDHKPGSGVGLSIVKRILQYHNASVEYLIPQKDTNHFLIKFPFKNTQRII
ncbi:MAG TPA: HAMP domain-containing protein [Sphingobacteriaceae bacterium]|nr:HAMP domain-containing protein [Sphingobacteriaceae bacterium]